MTESKHPDNTFSVERPEDSTGFLLWQVTNGWQRAIKKALLPFGLTHVQFVLMACVHWHDLQQKQVTQVLLSQNAHVDVMTTSTVIRTLEKKGYLQRADHTTDTRAKLVRLTPKGLVTVKEAIIVVEDFDKKFFGSLGADQAVFNQHLSGLLAEPGS